MRAGNEWQDHDLMFTTYKGTPLRKSALHVRFKRMLRGAGLSPKINLYAMRHLFATASLQSGTDIKTTSGEMGHARVSFTYERYGHVLEGMLDDASDKREDLLLRGRKRR